MTPTPTQIAEWREKFEQPTITATPILAILLYKREQDCEYENNYVESEWQGYLRARTEQAAEIAELKAKLAEVMPLAKFGAMVCRNYVRHLSPVRASELNSTAYTAGILNYARSYVPNIEATIEQLLKD